MNPKRQVANHQQQRLQRRALSTESNRGHTSGLAEINNYHVIARDAFGSLYAWVERYQRKITVSSLAGGIVALRSQLQKSNPQPDRALYFSRIHESGKSRF